MDMSSMSLDTIKYFWDRIGDEQFINNPLTTYIESPYFPEINENFGASFKTCFNSENLYVLLKFKDKYGIADDINYSRNFEIMLQTKEADRYEDGFQAATSMYGLNGSNAQYGRFIELGGFKVNFTPSGVTESVSNNGQQGTWTSSLTQMNTPETVWTKDEEGTVWAIIEMNFVDYMGYLNDVWGSNNAGNYVPFDPETKNIISFDVFSDVVIGEQTYMFGWSTDNLYGYALIYYSGYLIFNYEAFVPTPVVNSPVYYCTGEPSSQFEATGNNLLWYTQKKGGTGTEEPFTPSTENAGTYLFYVSQNDGGIESDRAEIKVIVSDLEAVIAGDSLISCLSEGSFQAGNNYQGESEITYSWDYLGQVISGDNLLTGPVTQSEQLMLNVSTSSGCSATAQINLHVKPATIPISLLLASYDNDSKKNIISWRENESAGVDSLYILRSPDASPPEIIQAIEYESATQRYLDESAEPETNSYSYQLKVKDQCGIFSEGSDIQKTLHMDAYQNANARVQLLWNKYAGREVAQYNIYKGLSPQSLLNIGHVTYINQSWFDNLSLDSVYYQIEAQFWNYTGEPELGQSRSNIFHFNTPGNIAIDTVIIHDTIQIEVCSGGSDTLKIDVGNLSSSVPDISFISVFPNPTNDNIIIEMGDYLNYNTCILRIISTEGRVVFNSLCKQPVFEISLNDFGEKGIYYLQFLSPESVVLDTKIVVLQ